MAARRRRREVRARRARVVKRRASAAAGAAALAPAAAVLSEAEPRATFVFQGTVKRLRASTLKQLAPDPRTVVVTVDHIVEAPAALAHLSGQDVTVGVARGPAPRIGQPILFHTNGWIFGDSVAVQSLRHEPIRRAHTALLHPTADPVEQKRQVDLRARFAAAQVVVSGRVTEVRLPQEQRALARRRRAAAPDAAALPPQGPASEHEPHWREAVIEVDDVHKGQHRTREVVIRFPASTDVRWYRAPKFHPGHQGFFMLHRTEEAYTALSPMDFQPYQRPGGIRSLITGAASAPGS